MADLRYINAALTRAGIAPITSLDDGSLAAVVADANYDIVVDAELTAHPWRFAAQSKQPNLIVGDSPKPWRFAWELPADMHLLRAVTFGDDPDADEIDYDLLGNKVLCNVEEGIWAHYMTSPPESEWSKAFAEIVTRRLHTIFLQGIEHEYGAAASVESQMQTYALRARSTDSATRRPQRPLRPRIMKKHYGRAHG